MNRLLNARLSKHYLDSKKASLQFLGKRNGADEKKILKKCDK